MFEYEWSNYDGSFCKCLVRKASGAIKPVVEITKGVRDDFSTLITWKSIFVSCKLCKMVNLDL